MRKRKADRNEREMEGGRNREKNIKLESEKLWKKYNKRDTNNDRKEGEKNQEIKLLIMIIMFIWFLDVN